MPGEPLDTLYDPMSGLGGPRVVGTGGGSWRPTAKDGSSGAERAPEVRNDGGFA